MKKFLQSLFLCVVALGFSYSASAQMESGSYCPDFTITDIEGNEHNLYSYLDQGYSVVIDLYAVWCGPCWNYHQEHTLENLHQAYGPGGTDEVIVLGIESDASTPAADIEMATSGNGGSIGDWTEGISYPMANDDAIANLLNLAYYPTIYTICPDRIITETSQISTADHYAFTQTCSASAEGNDAALVSFPGAAEVSCGEVELNTSIMNYGTMPLTAATITATVDGNEVGSVDWTGDLATYDFETVDLGTYETVSDVEVTYLVTVVEEEVSSENNESVKLVEAAVLASNIIRIEIYTDLYAGETSWELLDGNGATLASDSYELGTDDQFGAGGPDANMTYVYEVDLGTSVDCYTFNMSDSFGDGVQYPGDTGQTVFGYSIERQNEPFVIASNDGDFDDDTASALRTDVSSGVEDLDAQFGLTVYPNPSNGLAQINYSLVEAGRTTLEVMNTLGQKVVSEDFGVQTSGSNIFNLDLSAEQAGVYFVTLTSNDNVITKKVTITK